MKKQEKKKFQGALILSTLLHLFIVGLFYFGLPFAFEKLPEEKDVLTFELVPISEIANIKTENKSEQKAKIAKKSKQVKTSKPTPKKKAPAPKKKIEKKPTPKKKEIVPNKKKAKVKKKPPKKKSQQSNDDPIESILKNLEKESKGKEAKIPTRSQDANKQGNKTARGMDYNEDFPLSETEKSYIKKIINQHWRKPVGSEFTEEIKIRVEMTLKKNGKILNPKVTNKCPSEHKNMCKLVEQSILRALKQIDIIENLPVERYNNWKNLKLDVEPGSF